MEIKGKPDLIIESMVWTAPLHPGDTIGSSRLNVKIKNQGNVPAVPFQVKFTCESVGTGSFSCPPELNGIQHSYAPLAPNNTVTVTWPRPSSKPWPTIGTYRIKAEVDPADLIREWNNQNNTKMVEFSMHSVPPKLSIYSPAPGQRIQSDLYLKARHWPVSYELPYKAFEVEFQRSLVWPGNPAQWKPILLGEPSSSGTTSLIHPTDPVLNDQGFRIERQRFEKLGAFGPWRVRLRYNSSSAPWSDWVEFYVDN